MLDIKEIQFFVACAQTGSFSKAAEVLYTTQSSVSKTIKSMEEEMGCILFDRLSKGICMTEEAKRIYPHAVQIMETLSKMQDAGDHKTPDLLSVSCNPSSWFADTFIMYYELKQKENIHYQIYSADCREIVERVRERTDDVGFVYVIKNQLAAFQYHISRNYLEFVPLKETAVSVYFGGGIGEKEIPRDIEFSKMRLIQRFPDEYSPDNYWNIYDENGQTAAEAETVITTNSDYIMEKILEFGKLVNISGEYLSGKPRKSGSRGHLLKDENMGIVFGYVKRKGEEMSEPAKEFVHFIQNNIH